MCIDNYNITLERAMKILSEGEPWTIGTEEGEGWLFYFDGKELHNGSRIPLETLLKRGCVEIYNRPERKRFFPEHKFMELKEGLAFIVSGGGNGEI